MEIRQKAKTKLRKISRQEFDRLYPHRPSLEAYTGELVEWFANERNTVLGAIDQEPREDAWSYVVIQSQHDGELKVVELKEHIKSRGDAEKALFRSIEAAGKM